jgi:hypothetical protein
MSDQNLQSAGNSNFAPGSAPDMLGMPFWSANPVEGGDKTTLSVPIEYDKATVVAAEYFGIKDPGEGNGKPMGIKDGHLVVTFDVGLITGAHPMYVRAKDESGQWSSLEPTVLTIMTTPIIGKDDGEQA